VYLLLGVGLNIVDNVDMNGKAVDAAQTAENEAALDTQDSSPAGVPGTVNLIQNPATATPAAEKPVKVKPVPAVPANTAEPVADDAANTGG
jgi:hypothetical protein